jgi:hypothetical protein
MTKKKSPNSVRIRNSTASDAEEFSATAADRKKVCHDRRQSMSKPKRKITAKKPEALFERIVSILEQARGNVVRAVNSNMVLAYWLIGREIVQQVQGGKGRAGYGEKVVDDLSARLSERYGKGFSVTNVGYFKQFYLAFQNRFNIPHPAGGECSESVILSPLGRESAASGISFPLGTESGQARIGRPMGDDSSAMAMLFPFSAPKRTRRSPATRCSTIESRFSPRNICFSCQPRSSSAGRSRRNGAFLKTP